MPDPPKVRVTGPNGKSMVLEVRHRGKSKPHRYIDIKGDFERALAAARQLLEGDQDA